MVAYTNRMPAGIPGAVTCVEQATIEPVMLDTTTPPTLYGVPVKLVSEKLQPVASGDSASVVYGFLARPYPTNSSTDGLGVATPSTTLPGNVLTRGFINVDVNAGTASLGSAVYVRVASASTGKPIGGVEAGADSGNCVAITGAFFTGAADASGNCTIRFNI